MSKWGGGWSKAGKVAGNAVISGTVAELGGGKFANGAVTGAYVMLFNELLHPDGGKRSLKSQLKALGVNNDISQYSPAAVAIVGDADYESIIAGSVAAGIGVVLQGPDAGTVFALGSLSIGAGWFGYSAGGSVISFYYTGNINNFRVSSLTGIGGELNLSFDAILSANIGFSYSEDSFGAYIIGVSGGVGHGTSPFGFNGYFNAQGTITKSLFNPLNWLKSLFK